MSPSQASNLMSQVGYAMRTFLIATKFKQRYAQRTLPGWLAKKGDKSFPD